MRDWDRLIPQTDLPLNLLRTARANTKLSVYEYIFGQSDLNAAPLVLPGIRVLAHDRTKQRTTWAPHGEEGWKVEASKEHYRYITIYFLAT